jgi:hypothetical protein
MKMRVEHWSLVIALIALVLAIVAILLMLFSKSQCTGIQGGSLTLISICATFVVGLGFINAFTVFRLEKKIADIEPMCDELKGLKKQANILFHYSWGLAYINNQPYAAISEFWTGFLKAIKNDDASRAYSCICCIQGVIDNVIKDTNTLNKDGIENLPTEVPSDISNSKMYKIFKDKVESIMSYTKQIKQ